MNNKLTNKKILIHVCSPLQLICAYSLADKFCHSQREISVYIHADAKNTEMQIKNVVENFGSPNDILKYKTIPLNSFKKILIILCSGLKFRIMNIFSTSLYIFGDFYNSYFHMVRVLFESKNTYMVDDGFSSYRAIKTRILKNKYIPNQSLICKIPIISNFLENKYMITFSLYSHMFSKAKNMVNCEIKTPLVVNRLKPSITKNICYFIGTKLS